jgi:hypothetical protein
MKKIKFLFHPPLHHLHCKYGAPKQAKRKKINVFRPVSEQNFIPEFNFLILILSTQIFFPPSEDLSKF